MKKILIGIIFAALCILGDNCAFAQIMQTQPVSAILQKLKSGGYIAVRKIELTNDEYQVNALDGNGEPVEIRINAHTCDIIAMKKVDAHIPMLEVVEKIEGVGYTGISVIEATNNHYDVISIGPDGKKVKLRIDSITGKITKVYTQSEDH